MITQTITSKREFKFMDDVGKQLTQQELIDALVSESKAKYCPSVNGNCLGHKCAMFIVDRPCADQRYLEARCTHAGKRPLAFHYGLPKDYKEHECFYGYE